MRESLFLRGVMDGLMDSKHDIISSSILDMEKHDQHSIKRSQKIQ